MSGLTSSSNITVIAKQLIAQCNLIQPTRLPELEQLLAYLQKRKLDKKGNSYNYKLCVVLWCTVDSSSGLTVNQAMPPADDVSIRLYMCSIVLCGQTLSAQLLIDWKL